MASLRRPIVAGNWKMNTTIAEAGNLATQLVESIGNPQVVDVVLCPPFVSLSEVYNAISGSPLQLGAQNMHPAAKGAFTGEISWSMLQGLCSYVIIGHSERRKYFCETDEQVNEKVRVALDAGLIPIACVGEHLDQRNAGETEAVVDGQVRALLAGVEISAVARVVIAYEPLWAIGTGVAATPGAAQDVASMIRRLVAELYGTEEAGAIRIQYGGSVTGANAAEFTAQPDIDGALVGGASLQVGDFTAIVNAFTEQAKAK